jgi:drug/metabolite transporter (DMT)-like permease
MTYLFMAIGWALVGWCGTRPPRPDPPDPNPNPWKPIICGILGGIIGGFLYFAAFSLKTPLSNLDYATTCIGAFVGGFVVYEIVSFFGNKGSSRA